MIKAVLFDMDGVLIDAKEWHYQALNKALAIFGLVISRSDHLGTFDGLPTREKLRLLEKNFYLPRELHPLINQLKQAYTNDFIQINCVPFYRHQFVLSRLQRDGFKLAVCSNSIRSTVDMMLAKAAISHYFDLTLSNEDVVNAKPAPDIYLKAIQIFGVLPSECLVIEDNDHGIEAAEKAGAHVLAVASPEEVEYSSIYRKIKTIEEASL